MIPDISPNPNGKRMNVTIIRRTWDCDGFSSEELGRFRPVAALDTQADRNDTRGHDQTPAGRICSCCHAP
jgi:hypothetical protein